MCLWPGYHLYHDTAEHGYSGVVSTGEWNGTLLFSVMRVVSVYMGEIVVQVYGIYLVRVIFRSAFAHETQAPPQALWRGSHQL